MTSDRISFSFWEQTNGSLSRPRHQWQSGQWGTGDQDIHGTTLASSGIATSHLLSQEIYPDSTGPSDRITHTYNRQAEKTSLTDQNGTVRQFDRDALARPTQDRVTTLGAGVDGSVRRIERAYDVRSNNVRITSFDNPTVGSGSVVNEVTFEFNDFNQSIDTGQAHSGAVSPTATPRVATSYADGSNDTIRPASITYPNGRTIRRDYGAAGSITNKMNHVLSLVDDDSTTLSEYEYLGMGTFVQQTSPQPDLRYTLISPTLSTDPNSGDIYSGLDRFGRVKDVRWRDVSAGTDLSRIEYGYDRASNRIWRENPSDPNREHDWLYAYDGLHRLQSAQRGQLNGTHTAITSLDAAQCWTLDPTGNWKEFRQDKNGDGTWDFNQTRTANEVNEITDISNAPSDIWATPAYDKNGNTTTNPRPDLGTNATMTATFDAWNRATKLVDDTTSNVILEKQYDGRNFRIIAKEYTSGTLAQTRDYYFTDAWQCVEEHVDTSNTPRRQYVWGIRYIDDLVLRDRDISPSGGLLGERLYFLADANWNTTAVVSDSGSVQERYEYDPYGNLSVTGADFTPRAVSVYSVHYTYTTREWTPDAGLYYFRNRWYDALLGRFSSRDPIGFVGSRWSLYEYVGSMPVVSTDPSGRQYMGGHGGINPSPPPSSGATVIPVHPPTTIEERCTYAASQGSQPAAPLNSGQCPYGPNDLYAADFVMRDTDKRPCKSNCVPHTIIHRAFGASGTGGGGKCTARIAWPLACVCKGMPNNPWSNCMRGCLACIFKNQGSGPGQEQHQACAQACYIKHPSAPFPIVGDLDRTIFKCAGAKGVITVGGGRGTEPGPVTGPAIPDSSFDCDGCGPAGR